MCIENGVITKDDVICPVDSSGRFTEEVTDFVGQYVKVSYSKVGQLRKQNIWIYQTFDE